MRQLVSTLCVVALALVGCSDAHTPVEPRIGPGGTHRDSTGQIGVRADARPIPDAVADVVAAHFAKVVLPADDFSQSPDAVHPDVACQPKAWNGAKCWLAYTPYKNSDASWENPGILTLQNDTSWLTPPSIRNPLVPYPGIGAYNSDPDHAFDPVNGRLTQVYRVVADSFNKIMIMSTANAKTWTTARIAFKERNHDAISPSLVIDPDRSANIWYVRSGADGCNATSSSVVLRTAIPDSNERVDQADWSAARAVNLSIPNSVVWHLDVTSLPGGAGYLALVVAYPRGATCGYSDLWLATSDDGIEWKAFAIPLLWRGAKIARARSISTWYRGTLLYDPATDLLHVWPSGLAGTAWTIYHATMKLSDVLSLLNAARPSDLKLLAASQTNIRATIQMP